MLLPDFQITQKVCNALIFKDITPAYSTQTPGGYGSPNAAASAITKTVITLDFGRNQQYQITSAYNQTKPDLVIRASDIPFQEYTPSNCTDCDPVPCGCEDCDDHVQNVEDCHGFLSTFPSGCITIRMEVFTHPSTVDVSVGLKVKNIVSKCNEEKKFAEIADRLTMPTNCGEYSFFDDKTKRKEVMQDLVLSWTKLQLLDADTAMCDCDCIASRIKQINVHLESIK